MKGKERKVAKRKILMVFRRRFLHQFCGFGGGFQSIIWWARCRLLRSHALHSSPVERWRKFVVILILLYITANSDLAAKRDHNLWGAQWSVGNEVYFVVMLRKREEGRKVPDRRSGPNGSLHRKSGPRACNIPPQTGQSPLVTIYSPFFSYFPFFLVFSFFNGVMAPNIPIIWTLVLSPYSAQGAFLNTIPSSSTNL